MEKHHHNDDNKKEDYIMNANVCRKLTKILNIDEMKHTEKNNYEQPTKSGLSNCNVIIPPYYQLHKHPSKLLDIDYYEMIKDDIKNFRILNEYQLKYIKELSSEYKDELFEIYNKCTILFNDIINN